MFMRTVQFTSLRARKILRGHGSELGKSVSSFYPSNSVVQTLLRSAASDCTLSEFQLFASHLSRNKSIQCHAFPSDYHVQFPSAKNLSHLHVVFQTYADMCQALRIDTATREAAVHRERKNRSRNTISAQVLGVELLTEKDRRIFLGCNAPSRSSSYRMTSLYQESRAWFEGSWECGFCVRSDSASELFQQENDAICDRHSPENSHMFSITWEQIDSSLENFASAENINGTLRSYFPAVVLRTQILTSTVRECFTAPHQGKSLKRLIAMPQN